MTKTQVLLYFRNNQNTQSENNLGLDKFCVNTIDTEIIKDEDIERVEKLLDV